MKFPFKHSSCPPAAVQPVPQMPSYQSQHAAAQAAGQFNPWFRKEGK